MVLHMLVVAVVLTAELLELAVVEQVEFQVLELLVLRIVVVAVVVVLPMVVLQHTMVVLVAQELLLLPILAQPEVLAVLLQLRVDILTTHLHHLVHSQLKDKLWHTTQK
jgi:hypothetical protein